MFDLTLGEICEIVDGQLEGNASLRVTGISIDSRESKPGDLFAAIIGDRVDGHDFVMPANEMGAVASLASKSVAGDHILVPESPNALDPVIHAIAKLSAHIRTLLRGVEVIGITGSSGKTSTKDMIGQVLAHAGVTHAPAGSLNNELGLPLTLLSAPADVKFLVAEMGMRGLGHITHLCNIAKPSIGVITNVGQAHIGEVGSIEGIAKAKSELVSAIPASGVVVLNADDERVLAMRKLTEATIFTYGFSKAADVRAENLHLTAYGSYNFDLVYRSERSPASIPILGEHNVLNALAAAAVGIAVGMEFETIARALTTLRQMSKWRMEVHQIPGNVTIINDAYNANPESMAAALQTLAAIPAPGKSFAILGKMHELGDASDAIHEQISKLAIDLGVTQVIAVGELAKPYVPAAHTDSVRNMSESGVQKSVWLPDFAAACDYIVNQVNSGDILLFKASRAEHFEVLAEQIEVELRAKWGQ
ncbi:MAG: UDP-N-acetylmuramoyl-tripeptide--D-alanyl-D-alanine ligase [Candidatus Nanopelagicales bacterium]|nr:UDP-N-acetylmuramoyl-tripeptide--D-alanyl-D-alanine ligase [Candidatus Nanopelagicales bacterium]